LCPRDLFQQAGALQDPEARIAESLRHGCAIYRQLSMIDYAAQQVDLFL
jgi:hypothetical protein